MIYRQYDSTELVAPSNIISALRVGIKKTICHHPVHFIQLVLLRLKNAWVILQDVIKKDRSFAGLDFPTVNFEMARSARQNSSKRRADQTSLGPHNKSTRRSSRPTAAAAPVVER